MRSFFRRLIWSKENPGIKLIVFDFDGTLADTRDLLLKIISKHLLSFEISLTKNLLKFFGNAPLEEYLYITGVSKDLIKSVYAGITADFIKEHQKIKPCKNLNAVKLITVRKIIVSNNSSFFIQKSLNFLKANFFEKVYGADQFKNKVTMINSLRKKYRLSPSEIIYVGDKDKDVDVARDVGCHSVIISNKSSWSLREDIIKKKPDYLLTDLGKLPLVIAQLNATQLPAV
ncbi:HAD hydrolase-like protein [Candidatus Pacearchaeota archaeon]|nr:HAD hydrolase-like protein [Candidatus Pacearchaeota archaeon]